MVPLFNFQKIILWQRTTDQTEVLPLWIRRSVVKWQDAVDAPHMDMAAKKINAVRNGNARISRGTESPQNRAFPGSEGDNSIPPSVKIASMAMKEL